MDFLFHSLIALAVLAICLLLVQSRRRAELADQQMKLASRSRQRRKRQEAKDASSGHRLPNQKTVMKRELKKVPTPWGWPGSDVMHGNDPGVGPHLNGLDRAAGSLKHWIAHLVANKRTVEDAGYRQRKQDALRSMLEDRYGRAPKPAEMEYRKVKPPRLQDPGRPHDQMDNFPSGRTHAIVGKLSQQPGKTNLGQSLGPSRKVAGLENIRKPWGW